MDSKKSQDPTAAVPDISKAPPFEIGDMWNLKHEIRSTKLYELLIKTELKGETSLGLNNFYNHIKICLNKVTRLQEYLIYVKILLPFVEWADWTVDRKRCSIINKSVELRIRMP